MLSFLVQTLKVRHDLTGGIGRLAAASTEGACLKRIGAQASPTPRAPRYLRFKAQTQGILSSFLAALRASASL